MKCTLISDTHNKHRLIKISKTEVLCHAGDMTIMGTHQEIYSVSEWFKKLLKDKVVEHIIATPGNHDWLFAEQEQIAREYFSHPNIHILINEEVIINELKFYGAPQTIEFYNWAFNIPRDKMNIYWDKIPTDTDILITHSPPYGVGDVIKYANDLPGLPDDKNIEHLGCRFLKQKVMDIQPRLHVWGHIHGSSGEYKMGRTIGINAAQLDERYYNNFFPYQVEI